MSHSIGLQVLRAKIRGFHVTGTTFTSRIKKAHADHKNRLWVQKRHLGVYARYHSLAYGILRGIPYAHIEKCAPNNRPNPQTILDTVLLHTMWTSAQYLRATHGWDVCSLQVVNDWLTGTLTLSGTGTSAYSNGTSAQAGTSSFRLPTVEQVARHSA